MNIEFFNKPGNLLFPLSFDEETLHSLDVLVK